MNIGIDIDGVLTDIESYIFDVGAKYFYDKHINIKDASQYDLNDIFGIEDIIGNEFWDKYTLDYFDSIPRRFSAEVISKLKEDNKIYFITSRGGQGKVFSGEEAKAITLAWLNKHGFKYDEVIFTNMGQGKREVCQEYKIDLMIDDCLLNIDKVYDVCDCIVYDANYNKSCNYENVYRAYSWYDILNIIDNIKNNK